ncbi:Calx-beta domain-containing protein [Lamprocystis purpurea]|jgi:hypothetical protein|uniref:Calx-beta domain-containing protein n=1 Tax=Lamprocystis purpurea TaxID=61598 RepID=UPI0003A61E81|nr:Calx-beta domain-containing protein [Lamprocystis purpurea]
MNTSEPRRVSARPFTAAAPGRVIKRYGLLVGSAALLQLAAGAQAALTADQFIEARDGTDRPVIDSAGETWGAAWGDLDGDGCPDLWLGMHQYTPTGLFRNNCDGTFVNRIDSAVVDAAAHYNDDTHGVAWADFDNDGDQDLLEVSGGGAGQAATAPEINETWRNNLFVNSGGLLTEAAQAYGIDNPRARSRTPLWVDFDSDGFLDAVIGALKTLPEQYPSTVFRQFAGTFVDARLDTGFAADTCQMMMTAHLGPVGEPALICSNTRVTHIYDMSTLPFTDLRPVIGSGIYNAYLLDLAIGDFDGDLDPDVFGAVTPPDVSAAIRIGPANDRIHAFFSPGTDEKGFTFTAPGDVVVEFDWETERPDIFLGSGAVAPPGNSDVGLRGPNLYPHHVRFTLSATNPAYLGLPASRTAGIYIGFSANAWQVRVVNAGREVNLLAQADAISAPTAIGSVRLDQGNTTAPSLFLNQAGALTLRTTAQTFPNDANAVRTYARSVVAGDLDNDMDLDVYVGASGRVANVPNLLFDNQGNGTFQLVPGAAGAAGSTLGRTDTVTLVDYDQDGFLDLFVSQGRYPAPFTYAAEQQLFRNQGNGNHWVQLDLEGVTSTRDGIGAVIYATTPDGRVQMREQNHGVHRYVQDAVRTHFGLAGNTAVELEVHWPSGTVDTFAGLPVDQVHRLVEGSGSGGAYVLRATAPTVDESAGTAEFTLTLSPAPPVGASVLVSYQTADGSALAGSDYIAASGTLTFLPGETQHTLAVTLIDDALPEDNEQFRLDLTGVDTPVTATATATILANDTAPALPVCGTPVYNAATESVALIYNDCNTNRWHVRATAGGQPVTYRGGLIADQPFVSLTGFSFETGDLLPPPDYVMSMGGTGQDGLDFNLATGSKACFTLTAPSNKVILAGATRLPMGTAVSLPDFGPCTTSPTVVSASNPSAAEAAGTAVFTVTLAPAPASGQQVQVNYQTANGSAVAGSDYTATSGILTFAAGETQRTVAVPITDDALPENDETFSLNLTSSVAEAVTATATIVDNDSGSTLPACGTLVYDKARESGVFLWNDCGTTRWHLRATGGGQTVTFRGSLTASPALTNLSRVSIESSDRLPPDFVFNVTGNAQDGIDFDLPAGGQGCFSVTAPGTATVLAGSNRIPLSGPVSLPSFGTCTLP